MPRAFFGLPKALRALLLRSSRPLQDAQRALLAAQRFQLQALSRRRDHAPQRLLALRHAPQGSKEVANRALK
jgi:hypothetical protein